jgi:hypothetical protein
MYLAKLKSGDSGGVYAGSCGGLLDFTVIGRGVKYRGFFIGALFFLTCLVVFMF